MKPNDSYYQQALSLHHQVPVVDSHNDLAGELLLRHRQGETHVIKRLYLPDWKAAGFQLIVSSIYIENSVFFPEQGASSGSSYPLSDSAKQKDWNYYWERRELCWEQGFEHALQQIHILKQEILELSDELCLITTKKEWELVRTRQKIGILLYMEGLDCIGTDISKLHTLYQLGVRGASLTWSRPNLLATGCCNATRFLELPGRITSAGMEAMDALRELHMFLDISHLNNEGWKQVHEFYSHHPSISLPYIATHSNAYSVYPNYRNLTDDQLAALAGQGGVIGFNACKYIVGCEEPAKYPDAMCNHIEYIANLIGIDHIGFGFDLCDSYTRGKYRTDSIESEDCLQNHKEALLLTARLLERGMTEQNVLLILGLNWLRYFALLLP